MKVTRHFYSNYLDNVNIFKLKKCFRFFLFSKYYQFELIISGKAEKDRERYIHAKQEFQQKLKDEKKGIFRPENDDSENNTNKSNNSENSKNPDDSEEDDEDEGGESD